MEFHPDYGGLAATREAASQETVPPVTEAIFGDSQRYVPVLTGDLRASGRTEYEEDRTVGRVVYGDEDVDYATFQEVGTSRMDAQPYLRPAAFQVREL